MVNINQAVILCGGYGKRLGLITKKIPKPMIDINGKPFLEHLIVQLKKNGIKNIVLLVGYKAEIIKNYFKNGERLGVKIKYSYKPPNTNTGTRIYFSKKLLNKHFILLYSDNYASLNIHKLISDFKISNKKILISLSKKNRGNCSFNNVTKVVNYSRYRSLKKKFVEIGYMIVDKDILKLLNKNTTDFSQFLNSMSKKKMVAGSVTSNGYLSIGDSKRIQVTKKYFYNNDYILIDRDGTLNNIPRFQRYLTDTSNIKLNMKLIKKLPKKAKYLCITNQAGLSTGDLNIKTLKKINNRIKVLLSKYSINIIKYFVSHHHFTSKSLFRKPRPGMFLKSSKKYKFILDKTFYIGDDIRDIEAAYNANTFIYYIGKKKLTTQQNLKYNKIMLKKNILYNFNKKLNYEF